MIKRIALISSCKCNLNCDYCLINKSEKYNVIHQNIIKAFTSNEYINNVERCLNHINNPLSEINELSLWGEEPTLTLKYIDWEYLLSKFNNIKLIYFSTNGKDNTDDIISSIIQIDKNLNHACQFGLQYSYDGIFASLNDRGIDPNIIKHNIEYLINKLNNIKLDNLKINLHIHGVFTNKLIDFLSTSNNYEDYLNEYFNLTSKLKSIIVNENVNIDGVTIKPEFYHKASTEDGIKFYSVIINLFNQSKRLNNLSIADSLFNKEIKYLTSLCYKNNLDSIQDLARNYQQYNIDILDNYLCNTNCNQLRLLPDGTALGCQYYINDIKANQQNINLLDANSNDLNQLFDFYYELKNKSFNTSLLTTKILMQQLIDLNQINIAKDKIDLYAFILQYINSCHYQLHENSGSNLIRTSGFIRLYCNGVIQFIENQINYKLNWRKSNDS